MKKLKITVSVVLASLIISSLVIGFFVWTATSSLIEKDRMQTIQQKHSRIILLANFMGHSFSDKISTIQKIAEDPIYADFLSVDKISYTPPFGIPEDLESEKRMKLNSILYFNPDFSGIGLFLPNGDVYLAEPYDNQKNLADSNFSYRDWYEGAITTMKPYVSETYVTQYTDEPTVALSAPISKENNLVGIVHIVLKLDELSDIIKNLSLIQEANIFVVDHKGNIVLSNLDDSELETFDKSFDDAVYNFDEDSYLIHNIHGEKTLVLKSNIFAGDLPWTVFFVQPYDLAFASNIQTHDLSMINLSLIFVGLILAGSLVFYFLKKNETITKNLVKTNHRMNNFMSALNESATVAITNPHGTITYVNDNFCDLSKYSKDELLKQNHRILKSGFHSDTFYSKMWSQINKGIMWKGDIKNKSKNGNHYWVKTSIVPFIDDDGKIEQFIGIGIDISNQKKLEESLKNALDELRKAELLKEEFSAMVSHELKTPLTPIKGYCEMLREYGVIGKLTDEQNEAVQEIERNASRLERLISDILDAQKLDMERMTFNMGTIDLAKLVQELKNDIQPIFLEKGAELEINCEVDFMTSDVDRIRQVLDNLIKNSVDFIHEKTGKVEVTITKQNDNIVFSVRDNGIGIPEESKLHIFKKFYQVDTSHSRKHGGTGLGLVVCKGIVEQLGGKIWFESVQGKGTTFYFSIPNKK